MFNSLLIATVMLLGGSAMPATQVSVEPQFVMAPASLDFQEINADIVTVVLQKYTAAHWHLTVSQVWQYYELGLITIVEIEPFEHYSVSYNGGILDVMLEDGDY